MQQMSIERLTGDRNTGGAANISPDGVAVVYESAGMASSGLWLQPDRQLLSAVRLVPDSEDWFFGTTFSPDGNLRLLRSRSAKNPPMAVCMLCPRWAALHEGFYPMSIVL